MVVVVLQTYSVNASGITLNTGDALPLNVNDISTFCKVLHTAGASVIEIKKSGYYQINFSSSGYNTGAVEEGTAYSGMYAFQLNNKNVPIVNAIASASSTADTDVTNVGFSVLVYVPRSCCAVDNNASLTINYLGQVGTVYNANVTVVKLG